MGTMSARRNSRQFDVRRLGLIAGIVLAVVIVGVIGTVAALRPQPAPEPKRVNVDLPAATPTTAPDLGQVGLVAGAAVVQFIDKKDPNRVAGVLEWRGLEPADVNTARVLEPKGYLYDAAGRLIVVSADRGTLITPSQQTRPESGTFQGNVVLRMYPAGTPASRSAGGAASAGQSAGGQSAGGSVQVPEVEPILVARTDALWFDLTLGEVSTQEKFIVRSQQLDMDGRGMRLIVNEMEKGPELFEVASVTRLQVKPGAGGAGGAGTNAAAERQAGAGVNSSGRTSKDGGSQATGDGRSRVYRAVMEDDVVFAQASRQLTASRVEVFVMLIDGALPENAVASFADAGSAESEKAGAARGEGGKESAVSQGVGNEVIDVRWAGRLTVKPIAAMPVEFAKASAALRLLGGTAGPVRVEDTNLRLAGAAPQVDYDATAGFLAMRGTQPQPAMASSPRVGVVRARGIELLPQKREAVLLGPGTLNAADSDTVLSFPAKLTASFRQTASGDVQLAGVTVDGGLGLLSEQFSVSGERAKVVLDETSLTPQVTEVELSGRALATATRRPSDTLAGDALKMTFATVRDAANGKTERVPDAMEIRGNAQATSGQLKLTAEKITAQLGQEVRDGKRQTAVMGASAIGQARATDQQGLVAECDRIEFAPPTDAAGAAPVNPRMATTTLYGTPVRVTRVVAADEPGVEVTGERMVIQSPDGEAGDVRGEGGVMKGTGVVVRINGAGRAASIEAKENAPGRVAGRASDQFEATWTRSMQFDNTAGVLEAGGDVVMTMTQRSGGQVIERNTAKAESLRAQLRPIDRADASQASDVGKGLEGDVQSVTLRGEQQPANVEHRRFASGGGSTQRLVYLESQQIDFAVAARTVDVPVAGKLLVDQRDSRGVSATTGKGPALSTPLGEVTGQGTSLFAWQGNLRMDLNAGQFAMDRSVSLFHRPAGAQTAVAASGSSDGPAPTELTCDRLSATLRAPSGLTGTNVASETSLQAVEATGNVLIREVAGDGPTRLLQAHAVSYNAQQRIIEARGSQEMLVSFADPVRAPVRARALVWNQGSGEVRIIEPAPTTLSP